MTNERSPKSGDLIQIEDCASPETGRRASALSAVREYISSMDAGDSRVVAGLVDAEGNRRDKHVQIMVSQIGKKMGRMYVTRDMKDGNLLHVWRVR